MNRLYVGNLSFNTSEDSMREVFSQFGEINEIKLVMDRETGRPRGFAFVSMANADSARRAIAGMDGAMLDGRALRVNEAEDRNAGGRSAGGGGGQNGGGGRMSGGGGGRRW